MTYVCMYVGLSIWIIYVIGLYDSPGITTIQRMECIGLVHIQVVELMVKDMMIIIMETGRKMEVVLVSEEKENGAIEVMIGMVVMEIVLKEIMRNAIAEMVTGMTSTGEEVKVLMITNMVVQEAGALIKSIIVVMVMMVNVHLGKSLYLSEIISYLLIN